ncbi:MAG: diguanylate cyclase [Rhodoferax sp.]|nr:diguanylate cyclase [Rhodoferax sp.]
MTFMRRLVSTAWLVLLFLLPSAAAQASVQADMVVLRNAQASQELDALVNAWLEPAQLATISDVAAAPGNFAVHRVKQAYGLRTGKTLWIKLRVQRAPGETDAWILDIPIPYLDAVTLYQRDFSGRWMAQVSGDTLVHSSWSQQGLHPAFKVHFAGTEPQEMFLQIRNMSEVAIPIRFAREGVYESRRAAEHLMTGWVLGMLVTLAGFSLVRFLEQRNRLDLGALGYALLVSFAIAQVNGVLGASLWADLPSIGNYGSKIASILGVGGSLLFMRRLYALSVHYHRFDQLLAAAGWSTLVASLGIFVLDPDPANQLESFVYVVSTTVALIAAVLSWREKSPIWHWLMLATVPQSLGIMWLAAETAGIVQPVWEMRYYTSLCAALSVPVLIYALRLTTQERQERIQRANQLATQDALTGLLNREAFDQHLQEAVKRVREDQEPVALAVVSLVNHPQIVASFDQAIGEQCELRAVVKLHRVLRDVDPASRIGTGKFALLLQGVSSREQLNQRMVKLIASGLTPQPGLQPPVPLQFHVSCAMLHERPVSATAVIDALLVIVEGITVGTRRPIRFLEPALPVSLMQHGAPLPPVPAGSPDISLP